MKLLSALIVAERAEERWGDYYPTYDYQAQTGYNNGYENNGYDGKSQHIDDAVEGHLKRMFTILINNFFQMTYFMINKCKEINSCGKFDKICSG